MALQINTNVASLTAQRNATKATNSMQTTMQRLSSGVRINSARDDAAGLAISERMTTQIRGLNTANRNANDAVSLLQTAEGALGSMTDAVQRVRELALQASNGSLSDYDRQSLQDEIDQLIAEVDRIAKQTDFNGQPIFGTNASLKYSLETDADKVGIVDGLRDRWLRVSEARISQYFGLEADGADLKIIIDTTPDPSFAAYVSGTVNGSTGKIENQELHIDLADFTPQNSVDGGTAPFYSDRIIAHEMVHAIMGRTMSMALLPTWFLEGAAEFIHGADERVTADLAAAGGGAGGANSLVAEIAGGWTGSSAQYSSAYTAVRYLHETIKENGGSGIRDVMDYLSANIGANLDNALANVSSSTEFATEAAFLTAFTAANGAGSTYLQDLDTGGQLANADTGAIGGADADGGSVLTATSVIDNDTAQYNPDALRGFAEIWENGYDVEFSAATADVLAMHVGSEVRQTLDVLKVGVSSSALDLEGLSVLDSPGKIITRADQALDYINSARSLYGAAMSRMDSVINNNLATSESLSEARSRIRDTDFAAETANQLRTNILQRAALSMVTQASIQPQLALRLLA